LFGLKKQKVIDRATIDRIIDASHIVDVVSEYVSLHKRGVNYVGLCPFHSDRTPSFYVSPAKNICKCFACGEGGTPVHFIMKHEQVTYADALRLLAKKYHIEIEEKELSAEEKMAQGDRESMMIINSWAQRYFTKILYEHEEGKAIGLSYFHERGFREDIIRKFQLGYSLRDRDNLYQTAIRSGYKKEYLEKTGLVSVYENGGVADKFRDRVIFPIHSISGKVVAFGGRILKKDEKTAKYLNSPESIIYHKSSELYGIYFARQSIVKQQKCYLVEGYTDVISMHQAGVENVVAPCGTSFTDGQVRLIRRFTENVTLLLDGDAAGIKAAVKDIDILLREGMNVKVVLLPDNDDPDSFARKHNAEQFTDYIKENETDFIAFKTKLLLNEAGRDPMKKTALVTDIVRSISLVPNNIARLLYIQKCSEAMQIDEREIMNEVNNLRNTDNTPLHSPSTNSTSNIPAAETENIAVDAPEVVREKSPFEENEILLLRYVVRYGEHILDEVTDEETGANIAIRVAAYIRSVLIDDDMPFLTPVYEKMLEEAAEHCSEPGFVASRYFLAHPDQHISRLAADLVEDKYRLSKYHTKFQEIKSEEDRLVDLIPQDIYNFKNAWIRQSIEKIDRQIKNAQEENDAEEILRLMQEKVALDKIKKELSKIIGERIILIM
jgi:DNA primase